MGRDELRRRVRTKGGGGRGATALSTSVDSSAASAAGPRSAQLLSRDARGRLLVPTKDGLLLRSKGDIHGDVQLLTPTPRLDFEVEDVVVNPSGLYAAAAGRTAAGASKVVVLQLPQRLMGAAASAEVTHKPLGTDLVASTSVLQMAWHPMSDDHLVLLTADAHLAFFKATDPAFPEQDFNLPDLREPYAAPAGFAFPQADGWGYFTVLLVAADGTLSAACPLVPFQGRCPAGVVARLMQDEVTAPESQAWLHGAFPACSAGQTVGTVTAARFAPEGVSPALQLLGRVGAEAGVGAVGKKSPWCALAVAEGALLAENVNLLAAATKGGGLQIDLLLWDMQPLWTLGEPVALRSGGHLRELVSLHYELHAVDPSEAVEREGTHPALVAMETVELEAPPGPATAAQGPWLQWTDTQPTMLVVTFADHICAVRLPWLAGVANLLRDAPEASLEGGLEVPVIEVVAQTYSKDGEPMRGALAIARPMLGNQVVVLSGDSTCETLKLPAATSAETAADALSLAITGGDVPGSGSDDEDEELQKLKVPPGQWHGSTKVDLAAKAQAKGDGAGQERMLAGATLLEACEGLRHHYVSYAQHVHEELHQKAEQLAKQASRQQAQAAALEAAVTGPAGVLHANDALRARLERVQAMHENLSTRVELLAEIEQARPRPLNPAEVAFLNEMKAQLAGLRGMRSQISDLHGRAERARRAAESMPAQAKQRAIPPEQMGRIEEALAQGMELTGRNQGKLQELRDGLDTLTKELGDWQAVIMNT